MRLLFGLGFLQGDDLGFGQKQPLLRNLRFQRLESFLHRLSQTPRTPAGEIEKPSFLISLATRIWPGRLLQRKFDNLRLNLGRDPVRHDRLLTGDFLQRQIAAFDGVDIR